MATTLRPRSGKEYYKIDRSILVEQGRIGTGPTSNYANITPVLEKSESPSPGYMSSSSYEQPQPTRDHFLFPEVSMGPEGFRRKIETNYCSKLTNFSNKKIFGFQQA